MYTKGLNQLRNLCEWNDTKIVPSYISLLSILQKEKSTDSGLILIMGKYIILVSVSREFKLSKHH